MLSSRPQPPLIPHRRWGRIGLYALCSAFLLTLAVSVSAPRAQHSHESQVGEYELKAIYLYNFFRFVNWPDDWGVGKDGGNDIGVVGISPFGDALVVLQQKLRETNSKEITVKFYGPYTNDMDLSGCRLLFISKSERQNYEKIIATLHGVPVLTVAENGKFLEAGGMISLVSHNNKVRWSINRTPVRDAGLRISSKLLEIAVEVVE